jgi:hypothetical protein
MSTTIWKYVSELKFSSTPPARTKRNACRAGWRGESEGEGVKPTGELRWDMRLWPLGQARIAHCPLYPTARNLPALCVYVNNNLEIFE